RSARPGIVDCLARALLLLPVGQLTMAPPLPRCAQLHGRRPHPGSDSLSTAKLRFYDRELERDRARARPPLRPPLREADRFSFLPRPEPLFFPPPDSLFTVAQARRAASLLPVPRFSYPSSMCSARRF